VAVFLALRRDAKFAFVVWLCVLAFVPVWIGVQATAFFPAFSLFSILVATSMLPLRIRWSSLDSILLAVPVFVLVEGFLGLTTRSGAFDLLTAWTFSYLLGRVLVHAVQTRWIYGAIAVVFTLVALLAIVEFAFAINPWLEFTANGTSQFNIWGTQQPCGSILRAEGAFGHSIALGTSLGAAAALTLGSAFRPWLRTVMVACMCAAAVLTFSRTGMLAIAAAVLLTCLTQRETLSKNYRFALGLVTVVASGLAFTFVRDVFLDSGSEASGSAEYRSALLGLVPYLNPFGLTSAYEISSTREVSIGEFESIDNAFLLFGLIYGWVPLLLVSVCLVIAVGYVLARRATAATLAVVALIPALFTVAFITQYAGVFWFVAGLAVSTQLQANAARTVRRLSPEHPEELALPTSTRIGLPAA
jgi:hypothetical protein